MKLSGNWVILCVVVGSIVLGSCFDPPSYSPIPSIELNDLYFAKGTLTDTLSVSVKFKDGDGDIGLASSDTLTPYNNKFYYRYGPNLLVNYKAKRRTHAYDTLPDYVKPYYCTNWQIINRDTIVNNVKKKIVDTVYFTSNANYYNIFVDFYIQNGQTLQYELFDIETQFAGANCGLTYDGRLPILAKDLSRKSALEGVIRYNMKSQAFSAIFGSKAFKLKVTIQDRALHKSNTIETPENRNLANLGKK